MQAYYPNNLFEEDPYTLNDKMHILFMPHEVQLNIMNKESWFDSITKLKPMSDYIFALPMPNEGLTDAVSNQYENNPGLIAGLVNANLDPFANAMSQLGGFVPDPKFTQVYMGTTPRSWSGTWQFVPQNRQEAESMMNIIKNVKICAAPDKASIKNVVGVLIQPYVFKIIFGSTSNNNIVNEYMKLDKMALVSYSVNYFAQGYASTYEDGMPKQVSLTLEFAEYGIKTRKDWMDD